MKSGVKEVFSLSFRHAEDSSVEGVEFISQAWGIEWSVIPSFTASVRFPE
jgi:hypothetical protein